MLHETAPLGVHRTGEGLFAGNVWFLLMYEWDLRDLTTHHPHEGDDDRTDSRGAGHEPERRQP